MSTFETYRENLKDYAKDIRLNLSTVLTPEGAPPLTAKQIATIALACAYSARAKALVEALRADSAAVIGDADVEGAVREGLAEDIETGAGRHGRGDGDDFIIVARFLDQRLREDFGVGGGGGFALLLRAGDDVEFDDAVIFVGAGLGRGVALALLRNGVNDDRIRVFFRLGKRLFHRIQVVAVDWADVLDV